jgi:Na+-driven multidrug efflux pump
MTVITGRPPDLQPKASSGATARAAKTRLLLEGPVGPTLARLAAPNVIAMFVMAATGIAEGFYAGILGVSALAGLALAFPFVMLTLMLAAGAVGGAVSRGFARYRTGSRQRFSVGAFLKPEDEAAIEAGRLYFRIVAPHYALFARDLALYFAGQGAGRVSSPVIGGLARMAVAAGGGFLLTTWFGTGLEGVFAAIAGA